MYAIALPVFIGVALNSRAYTLDVLYRPQLGMRRSIMALLFAMGIVLLISFLLKSSSDFSRIVFSVGTVSAVFFLSVGRLFFDRIMSQLGWNPLAEFVIVDGVKHEPQAGTHVIRAEEVGLCADVQDPFMLDRLGRHLKYADRVFVVCAPELRHAWSLILKGASVHGYVLASELDEIGAIGTGRHGGYSSLLVSCGPLDLRDRIVKRALDLSLSICALAFLLPLMLIIALAIKLDSQGPIFFIQERLGKGNRLFRMYKFRSMWSDSCDVRGSQSTSRNDTRVTRVGSFIRSTSMDELPQLLNVLLGDMSFVGPRPHALGSTAGDKLFWEVNNRYWHRHATKPGITGLAQVRGFRGATHRIADLEQRLQADLEYLANWTVWRDVSILFRTFAVITHRNAF